MFNKVEDLEYARYIIIKIIREVTIMIESETDLRRKIQYERKLRSMQIIEDLILDELRRELK